MCSQRSAADAPDGAQEGQATVLHDDFRATGISAQNTQEARKRQGQQAFHRALGIRQWTRVEQGQIAKTWLCSLWVWACFSTSSITRSLESCWYDLPITSGFQNLQRCLEKIRQHAIVEDLCW